jgi:hypothetical protein
MKAKKTPTAVGKKKRNRQKPNGRKISGIFETAKTVTGAAT